MTDSPAGTIVIIGPGRVGRMLARLAMRAGWRIGALVGRRHDSAVAAAQLLELPESVARPLADGPEAMAAAQLVALSVPDDRLPELAQQLADTSPVAAPGAVAFHCSGSRDATVLEPLRAGGFALGSLHPLRAVADPEMAAANFGATPCAVEGDAEAVDRLTAFATAVGGRPFPLPAGGKALYHAGAVFTSNFVVTLADLAVRLYGPLGLAPADALSLLLPLLRGTVESLQTSGLPGALTGPIERGDIATVAGHLAAIAAATPELLPVYRDLARHTVDVAVAKRSIDPAVADHLRHLLAGN